MKNVITLPVAVVGALLYPRMKQEIVPRNEVETLEKSVARQQSAKKELEKLLDRVRAGEKLSLEALFPKSEGTKDQDSLISLRQDVVALQEEYEELHREALGAPLEEEEAAEDKKASEEPKAHPSIKPDRARLGGALFRAGKFEEALLALAEQTDPWSGFLAASCKERLGQVDEAVVDYEKVGEKFPETAAGKQAKAVSAYLKKRNKLGKLTDYDAHLAELAAELLQNATESVAPAEPKAEKK